MYLEITSIIRKIIPIVLYFWNSCILPKYLRKNKEFETKFKYHFIFKTLLIWSYLYGSIFSKCGFLRNKNMLLVLQEFYDQYFYLQFFPTTDHAPSHFVCYNNVLPIWLSHSKGLWRWLFCHSIFQSWRMEGEMNACRECSC